MVYSYILYPNVATFYMNIYVTKLVDFIFLNLTPKKMGQGFPWAASAGAEPLFCNLLMKCSMINLASTDRWWIMKLLHMRSMDNLKTAAMPIQEIKTRSIRLGEKLLADVINVLLGTFKDKLQTNSNEQQFPPNSRFPFRSSKNTKPRLHLYSPQQL